MVYGKVPPQAKELEEVILGAIMLERNAFDVVATLLKPETFYIDGHQRIYAAICAMQQRNAPVDELTVAQELATRSELNLIGGPYALTKLTQHVVSSANILYHAHIIREKWVKREAIKLAGEVLNMAYEDDSSAIDVMDFAEESLMNLGSSTGNTDMVSIDDVMKKAIEKIEYWRGLDGSLTGVPTGFPKLDRATRGWQDTDFIVLAARPSVGKTALMLQLLRGAIITKGDCAGVWSLEMEAMSLVLRMLTAQSKIILQKLQTGSMTDEDMKTLYSDGVQPLAKNNIFFDDSSTVTLMTVRSKARRLKAKLKKEGKRLRIIFVDYLQLMSGGGDEGNREREIAKISRGLKGLAKELQIPVIALSQMSRGVENRSGPRREPQMSDLRESGAIEQDADLIMLLWGPDDDELMKDPSLYGRRYVKIAKHRNGVLIKEELDFKGETQTFTPHEHDSMEQHKAKLTAPQASANIQALAQDMFEAPPL